MRVLGLSATASFKPRYELLDEVSKDLDRRKCTREFVIEILAEEMRKDRSIKSKKELAEFIKKE